jgi:predicted enzyme related to lactoylglutathione lyase
MAQPVVHWEIGGTDSAATRDFYAKLFDWEMQMHEGMDYGLVQAAGDGSIGGGIGGLQPGQQPYVTLYVQVDDLQKYLDKAESLGGKTILPPTPIPEIGSCAMFADINGVVIGLYKTLDK